MNNCVFVTPPISSSVKVSTIHTIFSWCLRLKYQTCKNRLTAVLSYNLLFTQESWFIIHIWCALNQRSRSFFSTVHHTISFLKPYLYSDYQIGLVWSFVERLFHHLAINTNMISLKWYYCLNSISKFNSIRKFNTSTRDLWGIVLETTGNLSVTVVERIANCIYSRHIFKSTYFVGEL